ncbi:MAG: response regulator [Oscillospiraceae bacterium]|nr:response regulator [Oscillospiraceae bacterium]
MSEIKNSILIVEDSEVSISVLTDILGDSYNLHVARNGLEGIDMARSIIPDLMLLDIILPQMDGYEVIKVLKNEPKTSGIPIIFVTALKSVDDERKGLQLGADDYINKPYDPLVVKLRVDIQMRIVNHLRTIRILSEEIESWMREEK